MIKRAQENSSAAKAGSGHDARSSQGVSTSGNALRTAAVLGLLIILLPALGSLAYVYLLRAPAQKNALIDTVAQRYADAQAQALENAVSSLRERVRAAVNSPLALQAVSETPEDLRSAEQELMNFFPEALGLRLLPLRELGTAELRDDESGLRNHIEIDMVRRVSDGEAAAPEAYQDDGRWLISLAQIAELGGDSVQRAVVLVTLSDNALRSMLSQSSQPPGVFTLEQRVYGDGVDRDIDVLSTGAGGSDFSRVAEINGSRWRVRFSPSQGLVDSVTGHVQPDFDILLMLLLLGLAGVATTLLRSSAALGDDVRQILATAEHRAGLALQIPALVPLAQELRRLSSRRTRGGSDSAAASATNAVIAAPGAGSTDTTALSAIEGPAATPLPANIFRAYDIRGVAESDLDDETVYRIGAAIGTLAKEMGEQTLVLGHDGRKSSARIRAVLEKALLKTGRDVINIGLVPTPVLYFAATQLDARSGIMITGSHNPPEYNGLKIVLKGHTIAEGTIDRIRNIATAGKFSQGTGRAVQNQVINEYMDEVASDIAIGIPLKVVVDAGNGATGHVAPSLLEELGCEVIPLFCEVDGSFPNRSPDSSDENNLSALVAEVLEQKADFGVAYDGDGDRLTIVTGSGRIIRTDTLMMLFAQDVVTRNPGADVVYDVKCSRNLAQLITSLGGRPVLWKTGHALMKEKMLETKALLGGEYSGHIFFGERWFGFDDGIYATGRLAEILSGQDKNLDELLAGLPQSLSTPEILIPISDDEKFALIDRFVSEARFSGGKSNDIDGLRVDFEDGWGLLRASNTTPALTARFEANDEAGLSRIRDAFRKELQAIAPDMDIPF